MEKVEEQKEQIGQLLVKHTKLSEAQLNEALEVQKETNMMIGEILVKKNYIHPHDIIKVLCLQINIPYESELKIDEVDPTLLEPITINYCKHHEVLPLFKAEDKIIVAMSNPFDSNIVNDLQPFHLFSPCGFQAELMTRLQGLVPQGSPVVGLEWRAEAERQIVRLMDPHSRTIEQIPSTDIESFLKLHGEGERVAPSGSSDPLETVPTSNSSL